jgi:hypothetical protein
MLLGSEMRTVLLFYIQKIFTAIAFPLQVKGKLFDPGEGFWLRKLLKKYFSFIFLSAEKIRLFLYCNIHQLFMRFINGNHISAEG